MTDVSAEMADRGGWFKSSYSNSAGSCVEVKLTDHGLLMRDGKDQRVDQPMLSIGKAQWRSFLDTVVGN